MFFEFAKGMSLEAVGLLPLLALPTIFKFLWAPAVDRYGFTRWGHYRFWIICFQFLAIASVTIAAKLNLTENFPLLLVVLFALCAWCASQDIATDALAVGVLEFIQCLPDGYDTRIGEGGATLSGGEKQRIAIARAILKDAPIVLLDEATASVDPENELLIQQAINRLTAAKTLIVIAHRLGAISADAQIVVLDQGQMIERGDREQLLRYNGVYKQFWNAQLRSKGWKLQALPNPSG